MLYLLLPLSFLAGLASGPALSTITPTLYVILAVALLYRWVQKDSARRQARFSWPLRVALLCLTALALPYYFFKSRGWRGGLRLTAQAWLLFIASMLCYRMGYAL